MKTYLQWRENFSATAVAQGAKDDRSGYGNLAAEGLQDVVEALRRLASESPQDYQFIVSKIRAAMQKIDPSAGSSVGMGGRRYGAAAAKTADNSNQTGVQQ
jgi:hypothetical protein